MVKKPNTKNTLTDKDIISKMEEFVLKYYHGINYILAFEDKGVINLHERVSRPCFGELRSYDYKLDGYHKPSDLTKPFPKGNPVGISLRLPQNSLVKDYFLNPKLSPWRDLFDGGDSLRLIEDNGLQGITLLNTKKNADLLANFCISSRFLSAFNYSPDGMEGWKKLIDLGIPPHISMMWCIQYPQLTRKGYSSKDHYWILDDLDPKRLRDGNPIYEVSPFDWYDRSAYHRPKIHWIWSGDKSINLGPVIFEDKKEVNLSEAAKRVNDYCLEKGFA